MRTHYFITIVGAQWDERQRKEGERSCDHFTLTHQQLHSTTLFQPDWRKLCKADGEWCVPNAGDWVSSAVWRTLQLRKQVWQIVPYKRNRCIMCCLWAIMREGKGIVKCMPFHTMSYLHLCIYQTLLSKATYSAFRLYIFCQYMCSLGIEPTTFALLTQCSTHRNTI